MSKIVADGSTWRPRKRIKDNYANVYIKSLLNHTISEVKKIFFLNKNRQYIYDEQEEKKELQLKC